MNFSKFVLPVLAVFGINYFVSPAEAGGGKMMIPESSSSMSVQVPGGGSFASQVKFNDGTVKTESSVAGDFYGAGNLSVVNDANANGASNSLFFSGATNYKSSYFGVGPYQMPMPMPMPVNNGQVILGGAG